MKLLTQELRNRLPAMHAQEHVADPIVHAKFFGGTSATWFVLEFCPIEEQFFGFACLGDTELAELGHFGLRELEELRIPPFGLPVERDLYWRPKPLSEVKKELGL